LAVSQASKFELRESLEIRGQRFYARSNRSTAAVSVPLIAHSGSSLRARHRPR
jgi:hypothetical protein